MAKKKVFIVTDLGGGDGGKGGIVHKLCCETNAHTVIKVGGAQGSHGVKTSHNESFNFSQFGCGTFNGIPTYISEKMVIDPNGIINEAEALKYGSGIRNIYDLLTIDENALCVTPFQRFISQLRELYRKDKPKGTVGMGVGEAISDSELHPATAIRARDLGTAGLAKKLIAIRELKLKNLSELRKNDLWESDRASAEKLIELLEDDGLIDWTLKRFNEVKSSFKIVGRDYLKKEILSIDGTAVMECSHGILTDRYYGFHPHTTKLRTIPEISINLLKENGYPGEVLNIGVTRAYQIRHGAGPMVTESEEMADKLLPGSNKDENRFQGKVRVGPLDLISLRYSIEVCGGAKTFDGLALTWFDQILENRNWQICEEYKNAQDNCFFNKNGTIKILRGDGEEQLKRQQRLGIFLKTCSPVVKTHALPENSGKEELIELAKNILEKKLGVPLKMISFGATENDKICI